MKRKIVVRIEYSYYNTNVFSHYNGKALIYNLSFTSNMLEEGNINTQIGFRERAYLLLPFYVSHLSLLFPFLFLLKVMVIPILWHGVGSISVCCMLYLGSLWCSWSWQTWETSLQLSYPNPTTSSGNCSQKFLPLNCVLDPHVAKGMNWNPGHSLK